MRSVVLASLFLVACASESKPPPAAPAAPAAPKLAEPAPKPITQLKRGEVKQAIQQGVGMFLQNGSVEDYPVMTGDKFHGWKIKTINSDWILDLRPGDVVTKVNGIVPEHPEDADAALRSLEKATALKVEFEREGKPRTLELPIVD